MKYGDETLYSMVSRSSDRKWTLKVYTPSFWVEDDAMPTIPVVVTLMTASILLSIVLAIYFTLKNNREIQELTSLFAGKKSRSGRTLTFGKGVSEKSGKRPGP